MYKRLFFFLFIIVTYISCKDEDDDIIAVAPAIEVQDFIWSNLNFWYFWQENIMDLADDRFTNNAAYTSYLQDFQDPNTLFNTLLYADDRFSYITENYNQLLNAQQGISMSNGVEFGLVLSSGSNDIFGYVRYVLPDSDASDKNIKRGDLFIGVNGISLNTDNYIDLLFGDNNTYTLNMAQSNNGTLLSNGIDVVLTKTEYTENPVFISKTLDVGGQKVGYLMYNGFISSFENELNDAFGKFQTDNITDLVLDLRYNPGGSILTSIRLASMVTGQFNGDLFARERWNSKVQPMLSDTQVNNNFTDQLGNETPINSLELNKVYILTTRSSASASELLINGLGPYINVIQIGGTTVGKNEGSITLLDYIDDQGTVNPNHTWAIQPLVLRLENSVGFSDYTNGLPPDITITEDLENLGVLGDPDEPLLAGAIAHILGKTSKSLIITTPIFNEFIITDSKYFTPASHTMYRDTPPLLVQKKAGVLYD